MLNPQKIKWMTRASMYEQKEGRSSFRMNRYFQGDFISYGMIKTGITVTIGALLVAAIWIAMHAEQLLTQTEYEELISIGIHMAYYYAIALVIGVAVSFFVYLVRYQLMRKGLNEYMKCLKKIKKIDEQEKRRAEDDQEDEETW